MMTDTTSSEGIRAVKTTRRQIGGLALFLGLSLVGAGCGERKDAPAVPRGTGADLASEGEAKYDQGKAKKSKRPLAVKVQEIE